MTAVAFAALVFGAGHATSAAAQTLSQFAAWDALMLSPIGAYTPPISSATPQPPDNSFALRFGRWRYNTDDAAHDNYGVSWSHAVGSRSRGSIIAGYSYLSCVDCGGWEIAGLNFETTVVQSVLRRERTHPVDASLGVRLDAGGALLNGNPGSAARSIGLEAPMDFRVRYGTGGGLRASLTPGLGFGRMWAPGGTYGGFLPMLGITVASDLTSSLGIELGAHRVFIDGGPTEVGVSLVWGVR